MGTDHDIISTATNKMLVDVGTMLLENLAMLLPIICANFHQYARELAEEQEVEPPEINSRRILCEMKAKYRCSVCVRCKSMVLLCLFLCLTSTLFLVNLN